MDFYLDNGCGEKTRHFISFAWEKYKSTRLI